MRDRKVVPESELLIRRAWRDARRWTTEEINRLLKKAAERKQPS